MPRGNSARWCIDRTMTQLQSTTTEQAGMTCLIAADCGDAGLEVVADDRLRHAADHVQGVDVRSDPSRKTQPRLHATYRTAGASDSEIGRAWKLTPHRKSRRPLAEWSAGIRLLTRLLMSPTKVAAQASRAT